LDKKSFSNQKKSQQLLISISTLLFTMPLGMMAFLGFFTRYWADDYCYAALFKSYGFIEGNILSYLTFTKFASNRFSLTIFSGVSELFGIYFIRLLPLIVIIFWLVSIYLLSSEVLKIINLPISNNQIILLNSVLVFFILYLAPNRFQILYWRSGMLPYLAPVVLSTLMFFIFLKSLHTNRYRWIIYFILFFGCFMAGGFSETAITPQITLFLILLFVSIFNIKGINNYFINKPYYSIIFCLLGYSIAFILLLASPPNKLRMVGSNQTYNSITLIAKSFTFTLDFIIDMIKSNPIPIFVFLSIFFVSGIFFFVENATAIKKENKIFPSVLSFLCPIVFIFVLISASIAPSVFAQSAYPELRALIVATSILFPLSAFLSWNAGMSFGDALKKRFPSMNGVFLLSIVMLFSLYCIKAASNISASFPVFELRAEQWDKRVAFIEQNKESGKVDFQIKGIDSYEGVFELQTDSNFWINQCAAETFGVNSLWTDE
jgi:hypothetical protein